MNLTWCPHWCPPFSSSRKIHHLARGLALEQLFLRDHGIGTDPNLELPARFCSPALLLSCSPLSRSGGGLPFSKISTTRFTSSRFLSLPGFKSLGIDFPPEWKTAMKVMMRQTMPAIPDTFGRTRSGSFRCQCLMRF